MNTHTTATAPAPLGAVCIVIDPEGRESFIGYRGLTQNRAEAVCYVSEAIARRGFSHLTGHDGSAFWNSEREAAAKARERYRGFTCRVEPEPRREEGAP